MFGPADGGFRVLGTIASNEGQLPDTCTLDLNRKDDKHFFGPIVTKPGQFSTMFLVAPYKAEYRLIISCPGYESRRIAIRYGEDATPTKPINVGEIIMNREK